MVHSARPLTSSTSSLASSGCSGAEYASYASGERKKDLLQRSLGLAGLRAEFVERTNPPHSSAGQKDEAIANAFRVGELVNGRMKARPFEASLRSTSMMFRVWRRSKPSNGSSMSSACCG